MMANDSSTGSLAVPDPAAVDRCGFPYEVVLIDECGSDTHAWLYQKTSVRVGYCLSFSIPIVFGSALTLGIIYYEMNVGDPMKRGIINRCISTICMFHLVNCWVFDTIKLKRCIVGPLSHRLALAFNTLGIANYMIELNLFMEILILRCIMLHKKAATLRFEDLWFTYLIALNVVLTLTYSVASTLLFKPTKFYAYLAGVKLAKSDNSLSLMYILVMVDFVAYIFLTAYIYKVRKNYEEEDAISRKLTIKFGGQSITLNTSKGNKSLMKLSHNLINLIIVCASSVPHFVNRFEDVPLEEIPITFLVVKDLMPSLVNDFVFPLLFYLQHTELIAFYRTTFVSYFRSKYELPK